MRILSVMKQRQLVFVIDKAEAQVIRRVLIIIDKLNVFVGLGAGSILSRRFFHLTAAIMHFNGDR